MIEPRLHASRVMRIAYWIAGSIALLLGILGVFLPVLPTTPFVLVAALCYSRASVKLHAKLVGHRLFGPLIREWHETRTIPRRAKFAGLALMAVSFSWSIHVLRDRPWLQASLLLLGVVLATWLARIPSRRGAVGAAPQKGRGAPPPD